MAAAGLEPLPRPLLRVVLVVVLGTFVVQMDGTMVGVALHALREDFAIEVTTVQWVTTGYLLAMTMVIPLTGWAMGRLGARSLWLGALALFALTSLACALAWSAPSLIVFRVLQGLGGGMLLPLGQTLLAQAAGPQRMGRVMAAIGLPAMLGVVAGPVLGGALVTGLGWRWIFFVNLPVCAAGLLVSAKVLASGPRGRSTAPRLDVVGLVLLSPALAAMVYGLSQAASRGGFAQAPVLAPLIGGAVLLAGFVAHAARTRIEPIIDLRLLRARSFSAASAVMFLFGLAVFGLALVVPLYFQQARGWTALHAGLLAVPQSIGMAAGLVAGGRLSDAIGPRRIVLAGIVLSALGLGGFALVDDQTSQAYLALAGLVAGVGLGGTTVPATTASYRDVDPAAVPQATSTVRIFQQLGGSFGAAVLAVVLQTQLAAQATAAGGHLPAVRSASAFAHTFGWAALIVLVALVPALLLPASPASRPEPGDPGPAGAPSPADPSDPARVS